MKIHSASDNLVITDMGITYLLYTFADSFGRYTELKQNANKLQQFMNDTETTPQLYDIQTKTQNNTEYLSLTVQKPTYPPLTEQKLTTLQLEDIHTITTKLCQTLQSARKQDIYHLDIGTHSLCYDETTYTVEVIDWYDSVLSTPTNPPFYISQTIPPELQNLQSQTSKIELTKAENYQMNCLLVTLLQSAGYENNIPQTIQHGCSTQTDERPTLEIILQSIEDLLAKY